MADVYHALGLHMHQPLGNLVALHNSDESWEARQILWCYDRPVRMIEGYEDVARLHLSFSGTLLKQLEDPGVRQTFGDVVNVEDFLNRYRRSNIEFLGSGLYHPVYPLVPPGGLGRADGLVAGAGAGPARAGELPRLLAAGDGFLHGDDPAAEAPRL
jgi:alpha-amylase/alpha-mannosidase (GH57 family)